MPPTVLLTNDDGPPNSKESPLLLGFYKYLTRNLGWNVKVVIPDSQKSWIGKAYHIKEVVRGRYFYPTEDGTGEITLLSRPLKDAELAEWILLDGTPATCANVALHNLYPGQIDIVACLFQVRLDFLTQQFPQISGPNDGRNCSAAFALCSGTLGAAMAASLSRIRAISISYENGDHSDTAAEPSDVYDPAHKLGVGIINYLWNNWGHDAEGLRDGEVDLYTINIPLVHRLRSEEGLKVCWTNIWRNSYGRLFADAAKVEAGLGDTPDPHATMTDDEQRMNEQRSQHLVFKWSPDIIDLLEPDLEALPIGSDGWAFKLGHASVAPLRAAYGEPPTDKDGRGGVFWDVKF